MHIYNPAIVCTHGWRKTVNYRVVYSILVQFIPISYIKLQGKTYADHRWYWGHDQTTNKVLGEHRTGVNGKVLISNWPWSKCVPLNPSSTNMPFKNEVCLQTPLFTSDPLYSLWERQKIENLNFTFAVVTMYPK